MADNPKPKVLLILEQSENPIVAVGLVRDCGGSMPFDTSTGRITGTWSRYGDGTFYVELTNSIDALQDVLIQLITERAKSTEMATYFKGLSEEELARLPLERGHSRSANKRKVEAVTNTATVVEDQSAAFSSLRAKLSR